MKHVVNAAPAKRFFVKMITRDIELRDAVLDLLDNCIDGVLRTQNGSSPRSATKPYEGFFAHIIATPDMFQIWDNCGGIPPKIADEEAFMLGRIDEERDQDLPTVGMYGIGMKRSIFKMGRRCVVTSQHQGQVYDVQITPEWLEDDANWKLSREDSTENLNADGTRITVAELYEGISLEFDKASRRFLKDLQDTISSTYAIIIGKGFEVRLNDDVIQPAETGLLFPSELESHGTAGVRPYAIKTRYNNVDVDLAIGFYRKLATSTEMEAGASSRTNERAGLTIICNDRVVLYNDKSQVAGWGVRGVPRYHNQFIAIAGVVIFRSNHPLELPLNTTKRGLDTSSDVYWYVLDFIVEGLKKFTDFTNKWKGREREAAQIFHNTEIYSPDKILQQIPDSLWKPIKGGNGRKFTPDLPKPATAKNHRKIVFNKPISEIQLLGRYFLDNEDARPSEVGERCFDEAVVRAGGVK